MRQTQDAQPVKLFRLAVRCPICGATPSVRVYERDVREKEAWPADLPVQTVQCKCGEIYAITAEAYHRARAA